MRDPNVTSFATPLAFNAPDGVVPLKRSPQNFSRKLKDGEGTKWRRDIAESFNPLSRAHDRKNQALIVSVKLHSHNQCTIISLCVIEAG